MATEQGHVGAMTNLGLLYEDGNGVAQSFKKAIELYTMAAEQGGVHAMFNLGLLCTSKVKVLTNQMKWHGNGGPKHTRKIHFHYHRYIALHVHPTSPLQRRHRPLPGQMLGKKT